MKKLTIYDIAAELNVTPSTVSRALNDHPRISQRTKAEVRRVARSMNYQHNQLASALQSGQSNLIGVMMPRIDRHFFSSLVQGAESVLSAAGYRVVIAHSSDDTSRESEGLAALVRTRVDGVLASLAAPTTNFMAYEALREQEIPLVLCDRVTPISGVSTVTIDDYQGGYLATDHLLRRGCRAIAHFWGNKNLTIYRERRRGYLAALAAHGVAPNKKLILPDEMSFEGGIRRMQKLLNDGVTVDGVFSSSDYSALGAMRVCRQRGVRVPQDIAFVGFANEEFAKYSTPSLSSIDQDSDAIGRRAATLLLDQLGKPFGAATHQHLTLPPALVIRESSAAPPAE